MKFIYQNIQTLPRLAWCAILEKYSGMVEVLHGPWVEARDSFFVDGIWDGTFSEGSIDDAYLMGTGGMIKGGKVLFCTPYHSHERLHFLWKGTRLYISPSLAFLLKQANQKLDPNHIPYHAQLIEMLFGYERHIGSIPLASGDSVKIIHFRNILVDNNLKITVLDKKTSPEFTSYEHYRQYLADKLKLFISNATSENRNVRYGIMTTISTGYDSPACSVLAHEAGCKNAVTFKTSRPEGRDKTENDDSGKAIGELIGLSVQEYDRKAYLSQEGTPEAEFVASGDLGQDFELCAFENAWAQKVVLIGDHGYYMWGRYHQKKNVHTRLYREDTGGDCLIDFRTRVGFIPLRLIFVGALSHPSLYRITNSKEMIPWHTDTGYDRPIARRIVEEKGVPRFLFGQKKKAVSILLNSDVRLKRQMKPESYTSFYNYYLNHKKYRSRIKQLFYEVMFRLFQANYKLLSIPNTILTRLGFPVIPGMVPNRFSQAPGMPSFLVHWGISSIEDRYSITKSVDAHSKF
jgi:hypothetical protein